MDTWRSERNKRNLTLKLFRFSFYICKNKMVKPILKIFHEVIYMRYNRNEWQMLKLKKLNYKTHLLLISPKYSPLLWTHPIILPLSAAPQELIFVFLGDVIRNLESTDAECHITEKQACKNITVCICLPYSWRCETFGSSPKSKWPYKVIIWIDSGHWISNNCATKDTHKRGLPELPQKVAIWQDLCFQSKGSILRGTNSNVCFTVKHF